MIAAGPLSTPGQPVQRSGSTRFELTETPGDGHRTAS